MSYPKRFRNNPNDHRTEIVVHTAEQEAAVKESGYRHEVVAPVEQPDQPSEPDQQGARWKHWSGVEIVFPKGVNPSGLWSGPDGKEMSVYPSGPSGTIAMEQPNEPKQAESATAEPNEATSSEAVQAVEPDRYAAMDRAALRAEYRERMGEDAPGRMSDDTLLRALREMG